MKGGSQCFCSRLQPRDSLKLSKERCEDHLCPGDASRTCGGNSSVKWYFVEPDGCGWAKVIESSNMANGNHHASNVLYDSCDDGDTSGDSSPLATSDHVTWWLPPLFARGDGAEFIVELACETMVDRVTVRNSRSGTTNNRYSDTPKTPTPISRTCTPSAGARRSSP